MDQCRTQHNQRIKILRTNHFIITVFNARLCRVLGTLRGLRRYLLKQIHVCDFQQPTLLKLKGVSKGSSMPNKNFLVPLWNQKRLFYGIECNIVYLSDFS